MVALPLIVCVFGWVIISVKGYSQPALTGGARSQKQKSLAHREERGRRLILQATSSRDLKGIQQQQQKRQEEEEEEQNEPLQKGRISNGVKKSPSRRKRRTKTHQVGEKASPRVVKKRSSANNMNNVAKVSKEVARIKALRLKDAAASAENGDDPHLKHSKEEWLLERQEQSHATSRTLSSSGESSTVEVSTTEASPTKLGTARQLSEAIDIKLQQQPDDSLQFSTNSMRAEIPSMSSRFDSMQELLDFNQKVFEKGSRTKMIQHVVLIFGKALVRDKVSVEYASRLRALARFLIPNSEPTPMGSDVDEEKISDDASSKSSSGKRRMHLPPPRLLCFCGGISRGNHVSTADAGLLFFRHFCASHNIPLDHVEFFVDRNSMNEGQAVVNVAKHIRNVHIPEWLAVSQDEVKQRASVMQLEMGIQLPPKKRIHIHFSLLSNEYHLLNLNDIHHRSPSQTLLRPLQDLSTSSVMSPFYRQDNNYASSRGPTNLEDRDVGRSRRRGVGGSSFSQSTSFNGIVDTSWTFRLVSYPYSHTGDKASDFLGQFYFLNEKLLPLYVNLKGVVDEKEFFQRDNFMALAYVRRTLVAELEELIASKPMLLEKLRDRSPLPPISSEKSELAKPLHSILYSIDAILENSVLSLGRCFDLLRPAGLYLSAVGKAEYARAFKSLDNCMGQIRAFCDPDEPLSPSEWGNFPDEEDDGRNYSRNEELFQTFIADEPYDD